MLTTPNGEQVEQSIRLGFLVLNNEAEYEAIMGCHMSFMGPT